MHTERNREQGVAAVEFALVLPMLLMMLFLIIEFSIALYDKAVITNASREGARSGIVMGTPRPTTGAILSTVNDYCASNLISFGPSAPDTEVPAACVNPGDILTVRVRYTYNFLVLPNFLGGVGTGLTLTGNTVMRCE
jgi:TadE-like protein